MTNKHSICNWYSDSPREAQTTFSALYLHIVFPGWHLFANNIYFMFSVFFTVWLLSWQELTNFNQFLLFPGFDCGQSVFHLPHLEKQNEHLSIFSKRSFSLSFSPLRFTLFFRSELRSLHCPSSFALSLLTSSNKRLISRVLRQNNIYFKFIYFMMFQKITITWSSACPVLAKPLWVFLWRPCLQIQRGQFCSSTSGNWATIKNIFFFKMRIIKSAYISSFFYLWHQH